MTYNFLDSFVYNVHREREREKEREGESDRGRESTSFRDTKKLHFFCRFWPLFQVTLIHLLCIIIYGVSFTINTYLYTYT